MTNIRGRDQSPNIGIGTLSKQSKSISNIKQCSRFVSKVMKCTSEAHKSSRSCYQSFRKIDKFYQNLLGSNLVNETYRIPLIGGGKKGKRQIFTNCQAQAPNPKPKNPNSRGLGLTQKSHGPPTHHPTPPHP